MLRRYHFALLFLLVFVVSKAVASPEDSAVQFVNNGAANFSGTLTPEPSGTIDLLDKSLLSVQVDGESISFSLNPATKGQPRIIGSYNGLSEGRHKGTIETFTPSNDYLDKKELLFIVDDTPPSIELIQPVGSFPYSSIPQSYLFLVSDKGSGVDVNTENNNITVSVRNASVESYNFITKRDQLHLFVQLKSDYALYNFGKNVVVNVSLQDRAGNIGSYSGTFEVRANEEKVVGKECRGNHGKKIFLKLAVKISMANFITPQILQISDTLKSSTKITWAFTQQEYSSLTGPTYSYDGMNFGFYSTYLTGLRDYISEQVSVSTESEYISTTKTIDKSSSGITILVEQTNSPPIGDEISYITLSVPERIDFDIAKKKCSYLFEIYGSPYLDVKWRTNQLIKISHIKTTEIRIPVILKSSPLSMTQHLSQKANKLICQLDGDMNSLIDINSSWFEVNDEKYWFNKSTIGVIASAVVQEGDVPYTMSFSAKNKQFDADKNSQCFVTNNNSTFMCQGVFKVTMDPPLITQFVYDRESDTITAKISDIGTPLDKLDIQFSVNQNKIPYSFNKETGEFTASLNAPDDVVTTALLKITDKAQQYDIKTVQLFGRLPEKTETTYGKATLPTVHRQPPQINNTSLGIRSGQNDLYHQFGMRSCNKKKQATTRKIVGAANEGKTYVRECKSHRSRGICKDGKFSSIEDLANSEELGLLGLQNNRNISVLFENVYIPSCNTYAADITPPLITDTSYNPVSGIFTAEISDHGATLEGMGVTFEAQAYIGGFLQWDREASNSEITSALPQGDALMYSFYGRFNIPTKGEKFVLSLRAVDRSRNGKTIKYDVTRPLNPPQVKINLIDVAQGNKFIQYAGKNVTALLTAQAGDESLISSTTFWIDNHILSPFSKSSYFDKFYHTYGLDLLNRYELN